MKLDSLNRSGNVDQLKSFDFEESNMELFDDDTIASPVANLQRRLF